MGLIEDPEQFVRARILDAPTVTARPPERQGVVRRARAWLLRADG